MSPQEAAQHVMQLSTGYIVSTSLQLVTELGIADQLANGPRTAAELASATGVLEDPLYRVLRALASVGVFTEGEGRRFSLNTAGALLQRNAKGSVYPLTRWRGDPFHLVTHAAAMHSLKTGKPAAEKAVGMPVFEYFAKNTALSEVFNDAMTALSAQVIPAAIKAYDFSGIGTLVDVAGGHGEVLMSILQSHPTLRGILMDIEHVIAGARPRIKAAGLESRCQAVVGDFFKAVPPGGDAYVMKNIIHNWDDEPASLILRNVRTALSGKPQGRVILIEAVLQGPNVPEFAKLLDLDMLYLPGGRERTADEFKALFATTGFEMTRIVPTESPLAVIEGNVR